jgi:hypothetical protein
MKKLAFTMLALSVFAFIACSSDSGTESQADQPVSQESETDTVELTLQSDISDLEERIAALEVELASLPAGPQGAVGPAGPAGPAGEQGAVGEQGPEGPQGPAGSTGATGATGVAGASGSDGALAGLTCNDEEFVATLSSSWQCAELGVTQSGALSGIVPNNPCCQMSDLVSQHGFSAVGFETNNTCDFNHCDLSVVGVSDHSICSLTGSVGNVGFTQTTSGVDTFTSFIDVNWLQVLGEDLGMPTNQNNSFSVQVMCGQGVVQAQ